MKQNTTHPFGQLFEQRSQTDRRGDRLKALSHGIHSGRRESARRQIEVAQGFYTDRYEKWVGVSVIVIALMSMLDAFLTLNILDRGGIEINPFMSALLAIDTRAFFIGKFSVTVICLFFALVHVNFHVLKVLPMKYMLLSISIFYTFLIGYELCLLAIL